MISHFSHSEEPHPGLSILSVGRTEGSEILARWEGRNENFSANVIIVINIIGPIKIEHGTYEDLIDYYEHNILHILNTHSP